MLVSFVSDPEGLQQANYKMVLLPFRGQSHLHLLDGEEFLLKLEMGVSQHWPSKMLKGDWKTKNQPDRET